MGNGSEGEQGKEEDARQLTQEQIDKCVLKLRDKNVRTVIKMGDKIQSSYLEWGSFAYGYLISRSVERQEDVLKRQEGVLNRMHEENRKAGRSSFMLFIASIILSIVAVIASVIAIRSSSAWQREQTPLLRKIAEQQKASTEGQGAPARRATSKP